MGRKNWKSLVVFGLVLALVLGVVMPVLATSLDDYFDELEDIQRELEESKHLRDLTKSELDKLRDQLDDLEDAMYKSQRQLDQLNAQIDALEQDISKQELLIEELEQSIAETEEYLEVQTGYLEHRLRAMYKNGTVSYLEVLFSASSFADFLSRMGFIGSLIESDQELIAEIEAAKASLEADKAQLDSELALLVQQKEELDSARIQVEDELAKLTRQTADAQTLSKQIHAELEKQNKGIASMEKDAKEIETTITRLMELERVKAGDPPSFLTYPVPGFDRWPPEYSLANSNITSPFGPRTHPITGLPNFHPAIDIARRDRQGRTIGGKPIVAAAGGTVDFVRSYDAGGYGIYVIISHGGGYQTLYAHMRYAPLVNEGDVVTMGQQIGVVGTTGSSTGNHLHFEVWINGVKTDPLLQEYR